MCVCVLPTDKSCSHMYTRSHWLTYTRTVILAQKPIPLCPLVLGLALFTYIEYLVLLLSCSQRTASQRNADGDVNVGSKKISAPAKTSPCYKRLAHAYNLTNTHTRRALLMLLGSCWGIYARVILVPIPVRLLVTHTYHKTAGLIRSSAVCMSFGPFDQLIVHMSAGRQAGLLKRDRGSFPAAFLF